MENEKKLWNKNLLKSEKNLWKNEKNGFIIKKFMKNKEEKIYGKMKKLGLVSKN